MSRRDRGRDEQWRRAQERRRRRGKAHAGAGRACPHCAKCGTAVHPLTSEEELAIIDSILNLPDEEIERRVNISSPTDLMKMHGAQLDGVTRMMEYHASSGERKQDRSKECRAMTKRAERLLIAAIARCRRGGRVCRHVCDFGSTKLLDLKARALVCAECAPDFAAAVIASCDEYQATRSDECDLCLARGVTMFCEIEMVVNGYVFAGDVCDDCAEQLGVPTCGAGAACTGLRSALEG